MFCQKSLKIFRNSKMNVQSSISGACVEKMTSDIKNKKNNQKKYKFKSLDLLTYPNILVKKFLRNKMFSFVDL